MCVCLPSTLLLLALLATDFPCENSFSKCMDGERGTRAARHRNCNYVESKKLVKY